MTREEYGYVLIQVTAWTGYDLIQVTTWTGYV
jgi:hypothetical protein